MKYLQQEGENEGNVEEDHKIHSLKKNQTCSDFYW